MFEQLEAEAPETDVLVLPETVLSGYFLEGGVREVARTREELFSDLQALYQQRVPREGASLDICLGFYELGEGKYYNSALYATLTGPHPQDPERRGKRDEGREGTDRENPTSSPHHLIPSSPSHAIAPSRHHAIPPGVRHVHRKFFLPTYGVFDEKRFVSRGRTVNAFETRFGRVAVII